jgi:carboxylate-amine ligase
MLRCTGRVRPSQPTGLIIPTTLRSSPRPARETARARAPAPPQFTIGVEEELFLVDLDTLACVETMPSAFEREMTDNLGPRFEREIASSMVELVSRPHASVARLARELAELRLMAAQIARRHGLGLLACGTHPFSDWRAQQLTPKSRYEIVSDALRMLSVRGLACGLHVHVAVPDDCLRVAVMNGIQPHLPSLLALGTSSPFWCGRETGLMSYRTAVNSELPRSGLPGMFTDEAEYQGYVEALVRSGLIPDESFLWWPIRPSRRFPTLEMRAPDCCPDLRDTIAIVSLYRALVCDLCTREDHAREGAGWQSLLVQENYWQAARHGRRARFVDPGSGDCSPAADHVRALVDRLIPSARTYGMEHDLELVTDLLERTSSADRQVEIYRQETAAGASEAEALKRVAASLMLSASPAPTSFDRDHDAQCEF